jgi:hypothetical protein
VRSTTVPSQNKCQQRYAYRCSRSRRQQGGSVGFELAFVNANKGFIAQPFDVDVFAIIGSVVPTWLIFWDQIVEIAD